MKKFLVSILLLSSILPLSSLQAQTFSERYTLLCPFLNDNYTQETINGEEYFVYNINMQTLEYNPDETINITYNIPISDSVLSQIEENIYSSINIDNLNLQTDENGIPIGMQVIGIKTHTLEFNRVVSQAFKLPVSDCDIANIDDQLLERTIVAKVCDIGEENKNFNNVFVNEMVKAGGKGKKYTNASTSLLDKGISVDSGDIYNQKATINLLDDALDTIIATFTTNDKRIFCEDRSYKDAQGRDIKNYCDEQVISIDRDAIAENSFQDINGLDDLSTLCQIDVDFKLKVGESAFLTNVESSFDEVTGSVGTTIGYGTVSCEHDPSDPTRTILTKIPNSGDCDANNISLYEAGTGSTGCDRQLCIFTGGAMCPPDIIDWGVDSEGNACFVELPFATNGTRLNNIENQNPTKSGSVSVFCIANEAQPKWEIISAEPCINN